MKDVVLFWLVSLLAVASLQAQTPAKALLQARLQAHPQLDTGRVNRLNALALQLRYDESAHAAQTFREALTLSRRLHYPLGQAEAELGLGFYYRHHAELGLAIVYTMRAKLDFARLQNHLGEIRSYYNLSRIYTEQGFYAKAIAIDLKGLALAEAVHNKTWQSYLNAELGVTSTYLNEYINAEQYFSVGLRLAQQTHDINSLGHVYTGLGDLYRRQRQWAKAQHYYVLNAGLLRELGAQMAMLGESINIAEMEEYQGFYSAVLAKLPRTLRKIQQAEALEIAPRAQLVLARAYLHTHRPDSAQYYARLSLQASERNGTKEYSRDASRVLAEASAQLGLYADAYRYQQLSGAYQDSLNSSDLQRRAAVLQYRSELAKKQAQIGLLTENGRLIRQQNRAQRWGIVAILLALVLAIILSAVLWRSNRQKRRAYALLKQQQYELQAAQSQLVQAEKWAFVGELSAGIAHELQNPLNFMKNFAEVSVAMLEPDHHHSPDADLEREIVAGLKQNLQRISQHGQRASSIIKDMLAHSRTGTAPAVPTDLNALANESLELAYNGLQTTDEGFTAQRHTELDPLMDQVPVVPTDLGRALLNLSANGFYATRERQQLAEPGYEPTVSVSTRRLDAHLEIRVHDNGVGMSAEVAAKIFQPFFTTKPSGEGTGLGLSLAHDIITKGHGGTLTVESQPGQGTTFLITLPVNRASVPNP